MEKQSTNFNPFDYPEIQQLFGDLLDRLFEESGRGALLIATAYVDDHLTKLIEMVMPADLSKNHKDKLFKYPGQLSSFSSKIELAYVFRLISKNIYDSLNSLRKIRNDAAHSPTKFELHELNEKLKLVYNLGPGFSNFIKEISTKALMTHKLGTVKKILDESGLNDESKQEIFEKTFNDKEKIKRLEQEIPFWELAYGLSFLCGIMLFERNSINELTKSMNTFSSLLKDKNDLTAN